MVRAPIKRQRGGLLLVAAIVLVIVGLSLFATYSMRNSRQLPASTAAPATLARIDAALAAFVGQHRRLPCPARGSLAGTASGAGLESINLATGQCIPATQLDGVVPWVALGLSEADILDPWHGRISYRVQPSLASNLLGLMNMSWCSPTGTYGTPPSATRPCTANCAGAACMHPLNYQYAKGLSVRDGNGAWVSQPSPPWAGAPAPQPPSSGAAYVLVAHGANGVGAYNAGGILQNASAPGSNEAGNQNGQALTGATVFVDAAPSAAPGVAYYDDLLSHPTLAAVLAAAALGPRPH